ncbi:uncharacterized protein [Branchiostoma lanceolatum]|uniref:uncharacterized protein n=1 Tax=Branchiostoma lanceolatum TaxID=7740 RepID=UPI003452F973
MTKHSKQRKQIREQSIRQKVIRRTTDGRRKVLLISDPRECRRPCDAATGGSSNPEEMLHPSPQPLEQDPQPAPAPGPSRYTAQKQRELDAWKDVRQPLFDIIMEQFAPQSSTCSICNEEDYLIYRCLDCGPMATFCVECLRQQHRNSLHLPEVWKDGCFQPVTSVCNSLNREDHAASCPWRTYHKEVRVFDNAGRIRFMTIQFCKCEAELCTLLRYGLWGASENPQTAFSVVLLEWLVGLSKECHISVDGFCKSVRWINNLSLPEVNSLYRSLVGEPISEFRHLMYRKTTLTDLSPSMDDGTSCAACSKENGEQIIMLDANFGLVRKKSSGTSLDPPQHGTRMFMDDEKVKARINNYSDDTKPDEDCNSFKAGSKIRSKTKQTKLDVTGVFGAACRHEIPLQFMNMSHGERLGYPVYLIEQLLEQAGPRNMKLRVVYDIGCILKAHLKRTGQVDLLSKIDLAIPIFHLYGHKTPCQILYSTRRKVGFGLTDGECMERIWSFLRPFFKTTKEMTTSHRTDLLTDALLHYARRKSADIEGCLLQRLDRAEKMCALAEHDINEVREQAPVAITEEDITRWDAREKEIILQTKEKPRSTVSSPKWKRDYLMLLAQLNSLHEDILEAQDGEDGRTVTVHQSALKQLTNKILIIEKKHRITRWRASDDDYKTVLKEVDKEERTKLLSEARAEACERVFLIALKAKYPDGQSIATKLSNQLKSINGKLEKTINRYNNLMWPTQHGSIFPPSIEIAEARDPYWTRYLDLDVSYRGEGDIPYSLLRKAIDALNLKQRAQEEIQMVKTEMREVLLHFIRQDEVVRGAVENHEKLGERAALIERTIKLQQRLQLAARLFRPHISSMPELPTSLHPVNGSDRYTAEDMDPIEIEINESDEEDLEEEAV